MTSFSLKIDCKEVFSVRVELTSDCLFSSFKRSFYFSSSEVEVLKQSLSHSDCRLR